MTDDAQASERFASVYDRRRTATLEDAKAEAEAVTKAIERVIDGGDNASSPAEADLAAGKLFEISGEVTSAETAYRRALSGDPGLDEAAARLTVVLGKQRRFSEALEVGSDLFAKSPEAVFRSLVYEGPLSICTILADVYRLSDDFAVASALYREGAKLEGGSIYAVGQAVVAMALAGEGAEIARFATDQSSPSTGERVASIIRLASEVDPQRALIRQVALRGNVAGMEALWVNPMDLVTR